MKNKVLYFVMFASGFFVGTFASRQYFKKKYEDISNKEIDSVREVYEREKEKLAEKHSDDEYFVKPPLDPRVGTIEDAGYVDITKKEDQDENEEPYVIPPEEFGEIEEYEKISLTYYSDNVLADENDDVVEDVADTVGLDSLNTFGQYDDDAVYVRNDRLRADYEILMDRRDYSEVCESTHRYGV